MARIIFTDLDGTLINDQLQVTPKTRAAIRRQIVKGNIFVPVSGRMPNAVMVAAGQVTKICPLITYNGALIFDESGKVLAAKFIRPQLAVALCRFITKEGPNSSWNVFSGLDWYRPQKPESQLDSDVENALGVKAKKASLSKIAGLRGAHKVMAIGEPAEISRLQVKMRQAFPQLTIAESSPNYLEIMTKGVSKSEGVKRMARELRVPLNDCYAFGDNFNDVAMLKVVGHPYLMGNAPAALKKKFENVTADNNHDGIAAVLNRL